MNRDINEPELNGYATLEFVAIVSLNIETCRPEVRTELEGS